MQYPQDVAQNYTHISHKKIITSAPRLFLLGIMAGIFIALASAASNTAASTIENYGVAKLVSGCIFPAGIIMVVLAGSELFTSNCMMSISLFSKEIKLSQMLKSWGIVYTGNFVGSVGIAYLMSMSGQFAFFSEKIALYTLKTAAAKTSYGFKEALALGILCNILVCISVWMSYAGETLSQKLVALFFPIMLFILMGFEHSVANMYYLSAGLLAKGNTAFASAALEHGYDISTITIGNAFLKSLLPVTLGNIIGGAIIVGGGYWLIYRSRSSK